jgi:putative membrane protein
MILDAILAYLHFAAIFMLFAFLVAQAMLMREPLDHAGVRRIGRIDIWYFGSAMAALLTGFLRLGLGAKGAEFYMSSWPFYVKVGLFIAVGLISIKPTMTFIRWRKSFEHDASWKLAAEDQAAMRKLVMIEVHLAALIPLFAVIMARGLGR